MFPAEQNPRIERVRFELRSEGVKLEQQARNSLRSGIHTRGYLPHVKRENASYFVTFRLADSLPVEVLMKIQADRAGQLSHVYARQKNGNGHTISNELETIERDYFRKIEGLLDKGVGECWLKQPLIAEMVCSAFRFFEGQRYLLKAWVIMPNHVHAVIWPLPNHTLSMILQSLKRYTARQANKFLDRTGQPFWQTESFDHWVRDDEEHARCCNYVIKNPVKAGLCKRPEDWKWSSAAHS